MKVAIVGSRVFPQIDMVAWLVKELPSGVTVVSGGAKGVDKAAANAARACGLAVIECLPDLSGCKQRHEYTQRYYDRNQKIVDTADIVIAFTEKDKGGTWDTIKRAKAAGKTCKIIRPRPAFGNGVESNGAQEAIDEIKEKSPQQIGRDKSKGAGPFAIKRVSLGSYALRRHSYIPSEEWAEIIADKAARPERLSKKMIPAFLTFFESNACFGHIGFITVPPRSKRNLDKPHVMDLVATGVAEALGVNFVRVFKPWDKKGRGRFAQKSEIEFVPELEFMAGKTSWVIDDVSTTNFTLKSAVQSLMSIGVHAHGLAYVYMA